MNVNHKKVALLETARLHMRPFEAADLERLAELFCNPEFLRFSGSTEYDREKTTALLDKLLGWNKAGLPALFALINQADNVLIGYCGFLHQEVDERKEIEIGYRLHPDYWNKGLATEAACAVRDHAFGTLRLPRVISLIHVDNQPSRRVAEKIGMRLEKEMNFRGFPTQVFVIERERWLARAGQMENPAR